MSLYLVPLIVMTVSYIIIIVIIWKKGSVNIKDETSNEKSEKSRFRRLLSTKRSVLSGKENLLFCFFFLN
jgi:hypothetical protein